ncbi:MAG: hypothetical protein QN174_06845 [Armatimonadota bacterium]|nr:hypothetical protein [Armatimonadota bacterium]MDR7423256.1 hypothetical protein [Armatimonadota bacterium]MDR7454948.1 hypothetical protein [Armatimonadota bacterium]MDR7457588.1 hypothetical protein [Armatimonadota bacterium]MDR7496658.1 hypothetical protein [Armatimonadota bacterium]
MVSGSLPALLADARPADREVRIWWTLAAAALLLRFAIMPHGGFPVDIGTFKAWAHDLAERGPAAFYGAGFADYLPGYLYVLWVIGEINTVVRFNDQAYLFALKLPAALADVVTAWLVFALGRRHGAPVALALSVSYLFNPGIIFNSALWGQADAVGAVLAVAGIAVLGRGSPVVPAVLLTLAAVVKPQTAPAALPAGLYLLRTLTRPPEGPPRWDLVLAAGGAGLATLVAAILPFGLSPLRLVGVLQTSLGVYPFASVVAFNLWGALQGFWTSDEIRWMGLRLSTIGLVLTAAALVAVATWSWRRPTPPAALLAAAVALLVTFVLPTRIHERYLLPAIPLFAAAATLDRRAVWLYGGLSLVFYLNLVYAYTRPYAETYALPPWSEATLFSDPMTRVWSALAVVLLAGAFYVLFTARRVGAGAVDAPPGGATG